jgi:hypothetical protein
MMARVTARIAAVGLLTVVACAETTAPLPPPEEFLLVAAPGAGGLVVTSLTDGGSVIVVAIGPGMPADARPIAGRRYALVSYAAGDSLAVVDVARHQVFRRIAAGEGAGALGGVLPNDTTAWVALSRLDAILRVDLVTGATVTLPAGRFPKDVVLTRGRLFVVNANVTACPAPDLLCPAGDSWVTVHDPVSGERLGDRDSIPLLGPGDASYAAVGNDGRVYVMSVGAGADALGRLAIVDPITRAEVGSFGGFGARPGQIAADRGERILVSSRSEGLMEFNTRIRSVVRGAGNGIPVQTNTGVAVDGRNHIFAIEAGACVGTSAGRAREFRSDLTEVGAFPLTACVGAAATALIPAEVVAALP